jgi:tRNA pseudouridine55 synthase
MKPLVTPGVVVVDKPAGPTSHDVVVTLRRALGTREIGHAGTLDPMATGVLVVAVGEATKLVPYLTDAAKSYVARLRLGVATDTLDALGAVVEERAVPEALRDVLARADASTGGALAEALAAELARTAQIPPAFSAIKQDGERAHARARRGEEVVLPPREVRVHELVVTATGGGAEPFVELRVTAAKGYYVRSLGRDLAERLGTVGHLTSLRRLASGTFTVDEAVPIPSPREVLESRIIPLPVAARRVLPAATLTAEGVVFARCGKHLAPEHFEGRPPGATPTAWLDALGDVVAIGVFEGEGRALRGFVPRPDQRVSASKQ